MRGPYAHLGLITLGLITHAGLTLGSGIPEVEEKIYSLAEAEAEINAYFGNIESQAGSRQFLPRIPEVIFIKGPKEIEGNFTRIQGEHRYVKDEFVLSPNNEGQWVIIHAKKSASSVARANSIDPIMEAIPWQTSLLDELGAPYAFDGTIGKHEAYRSQDNGTVIYFSHSEWQMAHSSIIHDGDSISSFAAKCTVSVEENVLWRNENPSQKLQSVDVRDSCSRVNGTYPWGERGYEREDGVTLRLENRWSFRTKGNKVILQAHNIGGTPADHEWKSFEVDGERFWSIFDSDTYISDSNTYIRKNGANRWIMEKLTNFAQNRNLLGSWGIKTLSPGPTESFLVGTPETIAKIPHVGELGRRVPWRDRLGEAIRDAANPIPGLSACFAMKIDMAAAGLPGLMVTLALRGEFDYDICNHCFSWKFESTIAFTYGLTMMGRGLFLSVKVQAGVELREMRCIEANSAPFCQYLHLMVPSDRGVSVVGQKERCHSYSPFEVLTAYIQYWWRALGHRWKNGEYSSMMQKRNSQHPWLDEKMRSWSEEIQNLYPDEDNSQSIMNFENDLERQISSVTPDMMKYRTTFKRETGPKKADDRRLTSDWLALELRHGALFRPQETKNVNHILLQRVVETAENAVMPILCWNVPKDTTDCPTAKHDKPGETYDQISLGSIKSFEYDEKTVSVRANFHHDLQSTQTNVQEFQFKSEKAGKQWIEAIQEAKKTWDLGGRKKMLNVGCIKAVDVPRWGDGWINNPDPFCEVEVLGQNHRTAYHLDELNPVWNSTTTFAIDQDHGRYNNRGFQVVLRLWDLDQNFLVRRQLMASRVCTLYEIIPGEKPMGESKPEECVLQVPSITAGSLKVIDAGKNGEHDLSGVYTRMDWHKWTNKKYFLYAKEVDEKTENTEFIWIFTDTSGHVYKTSKSRSTNPADAKWKDAKIKRIYDYNDVDENYDGNIVVNYSSGPCKKAKVHLTFGFVLEPNMPYSREYPGLGFAFQAHHAAAHQFTGKLFRYGMQVAAGFIYTESGHDETVSYINSQGRYLARNLANSKLRTVASSDTTKSNSDTSFFDKMRDAIDIIRRKFNDIVAKVKRKNPCAMLHNPIGDGRMLNFCNAIALSIFKDGDEGYDDKAGKAPMDFYAEMATSIANAYVRTVADVQSLFNKYFADDAFFDGDCLGMNPIHHLPYEFATGRPNQFYTEPQGFSEVWATQRTREHVREQGEVIHRDDDSTCIYDWISPTIGRTAGTAFATVTPPDNSGKFHQPTPQGPLKSIMHPQFLCELTKHKGNDYMAYQNACRQLKYETFFNSTDADMKSTITSWRRFDCERATIQPMLKALFPKMVEKMHEIRKDLGTLLEDVLQCAGRISPAMREFPNKNADDIHFACNLNFEDLASQFFRQSNGTFNKAESQLLNRNVLRQKTIQMISVMQRFIEYLQTHAPPGAGMDTSQFLGKHDEDPMFMEDFMNQHQFWDLGGSQAFLGGMYTKEGLERAATLFDSEEKILKRVNDTKIHLVTKAWEESGESHIFPVPVHFVEWSVFDFGIRFDFSKIEEPCKGADLYVLPTTAELGVRFLKEGLTWAPHFEADSFACVEFDFRPIDKMVVQLQRCTAGNDIVKWKIGTQSILALEETSEVHTVFNKNIKQHLDHLAAQNQLKPEELEKYKVNTDAVWKIAKESLLPNGKLHITSDSAQEMWHGITQMMGGTKNTLAEEAKKFETDIMAKKSKNINKAVKNYDLSLANAKVLDISIIISSSSDSNWHKTFDVSYKTMTQAAFNFDAPGVFKTQSAMSFTLKHDLSKVFEVFFGADQNTDDPDPFDHCVQCFSLDQRNYYNRPIPTKACVIPAENHGGEADVSCRNVTDACPSGGTPVESAFKCGTIQKKSKPAINDLLEQVWSHFYTNEGEKSKSVDKAAVLHKNVSMTHVQFFDGNIQSIPNGWIESVEKPPSCPDNDTDPFAIDDRKSAEVDTNTTLPPKSSTDAIKKDPKKDAHDSKKEHRSDDQSYGWRNDAEGWSVGTIVAVTTLLTLSTQAALYFVIRHMRR